jgi:hypothetical protein
VKSLFILITSAIAVLVAVLLLSLYGYHADRPNEPLLRFLRWLPGISVALLAGCVGGTLEGLLEISRRGDDLGSTPVPVSSVDSVRFAVKPILGSLSASVVFFAMAAGLTSLNFSELVTPALDPRDPNFGSLGYLIDTMTPRTSGALSKLIIYSLLSGYFYPTLPSFIGLLDSHLRGDKKS